MKRTNKDNDIIITSLGGSTNQVTGSCFSISYPKNDKTRGLIVIECGLSQDGNTVEENYYNNKKILENIKKETVENCEYLFVNHTHVDHIGSMAFFNDDNGFKGEVIGSKETLALSKDLIANTIMIHEKDIEYLRSIGKKSKPLYTKQHMYQLFEHYSPMNVGEIIKLNDNLSFIMRNNSHCLGSTNITLLFTKPNNQKKSICYTSDMGSIYNKDVSYYLKEQELPQKCNLLISEATYSDRSRQINFDMVKKEREELKKQIEKSIKAGKRMLFPTFSFSRSQLLITYFYLWFKDEEWFNDIPVVIDGMLVNDINKTYLKILDGEDKELFKSVMDWKNIKVNYNYDSTIATLSKHTCGIYITSSGFMQNGRITSYLPQFVENSKDVVVITGYCGNKDSIGANLYDKEKNIIKLYGRVHQKKCEVLNYATFSSHISYDELLKLWCGINCDKILIHHCDEKNKANIISEAKEYLSERNKTTKIIPISQCSYQFVL